MPPSPELGTWRGSASPAGVKLLNPLFEYLPELLPAPKFIRIKRTTTGLLPWRTRGGPVDHRLSFLSFPSSSSSSFRPGRIPPENTNDRATSAFCNLFWIRIMGIGESRLSFLNGDVLIILRFKFPLSLFSDSLASALDGGKF